MKSLLPLVVLATALRVGWGAWTLPDPVLEVEANKVKVTLEGPRKLKGATFFMSVDGSFRKLRLADYRFKLSCQRQSTVKICSGTGGPTLSPGDTVYYAIKAKVGRKVQKLTGMSWTPLLTTQGPNPPCNSFTGSLPNGCVENVFTEPDPDIPTGRGNPERGWYGHTETKTSVWSPVDSGTLQTWVQEGHSLIYRNIILDTFVNSDITEDVLQKIRDDFVTIRENGVKVILRFCYSIDVNNIEDAPPTQLSRHIEQLAPILQDNSPLIAVVQAGFIGVWGEWYYTANYGNEGQLSEADWANRRQVVQDLLQALPASREVQLRTPNYKQTLLVRTAPLTEEEAHGDTEVARIGHHNDCFLASDTDFGTYVNKAEEYPYLQDETKYVTMGGETCILNSPRSDCSTALTELQELHYTYLNKDYHPDVLASWTSQGCFNQVRSSLGYRLVGVKVRMPGTAAPGSSVDVGVIVRNIGWAAPINYRATELLLRHATTGDTFRSGTSGDLRSWLPGDHELQLIVDLPSSATSGEYQVLLNLPDGDVSLYDLPAYNIVMENTQVPENTGDRLNLMGTIMVAS